MERVSLEEEVLGTTINGHDDNGSDDVAECIDEPRESNLVNAKQSSICHIPYVDVPKLEFCLASTEIVFGACERSPRSCM